jgi:hypothetical protein
MKDESEAWLKVEWRLNLNENWIRSYKRCIVTMNQFVNKFQKPNHQISNHTEISKTSFFLTITKLKTEPEFWRLKLKVEWISGEGWTKMKSKNESEAW